MPSSAIEERVCRVGNSYSKSKKCSAGVPQGSVLGPVLFACYINTLAKTLEHVENLSHGFFADDLTLWRTNDNVKTDGMQIVQKGLDTIGNWCNDYARWKQLQRNVKQFCSPTGQVTLLGFECHI